MVRIGPPVLLASLLLLVSTGCGAGARQPPPAKLPHALVTDWVKQADEIAAAAGAGDGCRARQLASRLRTDVIDKKALVPSRLRAPLLTAVDSLAARIVCPPQTVSTTPTKGGPPPGKGKDHGHGPGKDHGHGKGKDG